MTAEEKHAEPEMNEHQKQLVDSSFEEGQYTSGIRALDQLRSPNYRPAEHHIRQLIYIALYPPNANRVPQPPGSPTKMDKRRIKVQTLSISPEASSSAQNLLFSFAQTNSLESILNALPAFSRSRDVVDSDSDSALANEALCIVRCKSCWDMLVKDFIKVGVNLVDGRSKGYQTSDSEEDGVESVVADHAWPILKWLLFLFERDEAQTEAKGLPRYSPFFLEQIPKPRGERNPRWEADAPLDIVFSCLCASESQQLLGARLLTLLINISCTSYFDFQAFLTAVYKRVSAQSDMMNPFLTLLSRLPSIQPVLRFKVAFLHKCIGPPATATTSSRPKPQARALPKRRGGASNPAPSEDASAQPVANKPAMPSFADISKALESSTKNHSAKNAAKFELLVSYGTLQSQTSESERDPDWMKSGNGGGWESLLSSVFHSGEDAGNYRTTLSVLRATW
ncbi:Superkiller protein 3 [Marasmius tenuissimus]|uniref:Superkiller protein 3 n=1 Tax=Marasmius tenuissimus TaxID=585030 RepID=A0ABR3A7Z3_9AGAR